MQRTIKSMMPLTRLHVFYLFLAVAGTAFSATFADLAVLMAKEYFGGHVGPDASLEQCSAFLNSRGVCFSLFDLMDDRRSVTEEDVARAVGQLILLFSGEAEVLNGCIKKPLEVKTWVDYCLLNDVNLAAILDRIAQKTADGTLPEVRAFFGK